MKFCSFFHPAAPLCAALLLSCAVKPALAQTSTPTDDTNTLVVTPNKYGTPPDKTGSDVSIISHADIERASPASLVAVLREVPGLDIHETGGPGSQTALTLRGASPGQTLVLLDGERVGDPANTDGALDFSSIALANIARIEVLRGPQSALYGSDAMGGVINIITKSGAQKPSSSVLVEGGSHATLHTQLASNGGVGVFTYAIGLDGVSSAGFPKYGYRIARKLTIGDGITALPPLPSTEPMARGGANLKLGYALSQTLALEGSAYAASNHIRFDNPYALAASDVFSPFNRSTADLIKDSLKLKSSLFEDAFKSQLTVFNQSVARDVDGTEACFDSAFSPFTCKNTYRGQRTGLDYQGVLAFAALGSANNTRAPLGTLSFGARHEREDASTNEYPNPSDGSFYPIAAHQITQSAYVQHAIEPLQNLTFTYGARLDAVLEGKTFITGRSTLAYTIAQTQTKLRASYGTGAKAPALYERFSQYGTGALLPETNRGFDIGVDQKILWNRAQVSATYFDSRYANLINFSNSAGCTPLQQALGGCYYNTSRAKITGVELSGTYDVVPALITMRASYTFQNARDMATDQTLLQRPRSKASASLIYTPINTLALEARVTVSGPKLDYASPQPVRLAPYGLLDLRATYRASKTMDVFANIENVTNAHYQDVYNYGTAGRACYGGIKVSW